MDGRESQRPIVVSKWGNGLPDPVERRGCRVVDGELEPRRGHRASPACHRETTQSCEGQRFHSVTNRMLEFCTSGRVEQETHLVTPPRPTSQVPIIELSALLQLVEWYQVRLRRNQQGGSSCVDPEPPLSPPAPDQGSPSPQSAPALAQLDRRIPRANPGHPQSRRGPAARSASSHPGGDQ